MNVRTVKEISLITCYDTFSNQVFLSNTQCVIDFSYHIKGNFTCFIAVLTLFSVKTVQLGMNKTKNRLPRKVCIIHICIKFNLNKGIFSRLIIDIFVNSSTHSVQCILVIACTPINIFFTSNCIVHTRIVLYCVLYFVL